MLSADVRICSIRTKHCLSIKICMAKEDICEGGLAGHCANAAPGFFSVGMKEVLCNTCQKCIRANAQSGWKV